MDVRMPVLDGVEATRTIATALPETRIVALTGSDDRQVVSAMLEAGASTHCVKGAPLGELERAVLEGRRRDAPRSTDGPSGPPRLRAGAGRAPGRPRARAVRPRPPRHRRRRGRRRPRGGAPRGRRGPRRGGRLPAGRRRAGRARGGWRGRSRARRRPAAHRPSPPAALRLGGRRRLPGRRHDGGQAARDRRLPSLRRQGRGRRPTTSASSTPTLRGPRRRTLPPPPRWIGTAGGIPTPA